MEIYGTEAVSRYLLNDVYLRKRAFGKKHRLDMGTKMHSNIMYLCGTGVEGNWRPRCRHLFVNFFVISEIQVAGGVSHHLTL